MIVMHQAIAQQAVTRILVYKATECGVHHTSPGKDGWERMSALFSPTVHTFWDGKRANGQIGHATKAGLARAEERLSSCRFRVLLKGLKSTSWGRLQPTEATGCPFWIIPVPAALQDNEGNLLSNHPSEHTVHSPLSNPFPPLTVALKRPDNSGR